VRPPARQAYSQKKDTNGYMGVNSRKLDIQSGQRNQINGASQETRTTPIVYPYNTAYLSVTAFLRAAWVGGGLR